MYPRFCSEDHWQVLNDYNNLSFCIIPIIVSNLGMAYFYTDLKWESGRKVLNWSFTPTQLYHFLVSICVSFCITRSYMLRYSIENLWLNILIFLSINYLCLYYSFSNLISTHILVILTITHLVGNFQQYSKM